MSLFGIFSGRSEPQPENIVLPREQYPDGHRLIVGERSYSREGPLNARHYIDQVLEVVDSTPSEIMALGLNIERIVLERAKALPPPPCGVVPISFNFAIYAPLPGTDSPADCLSITIDADEESTDTRAHFVNSSHADAVVEELLMIGDVCFDLLEFANIGVDARDSSERSPPKEGMAELWRSTSYDRILGYGVGYHVRIHRDDFAKLAQAASTFRYGKPTFDWN